MSRGAFERGFFKSVWVFFTVISLSIAGAETTSRQGDARTEVKGEALLVGGIPFFPVGLYYAPVEKYRQIKEMGFNVVHLWAVDDGSTLKALNEAQRLGLKAVLELTDVWRDQVFDLKKLREYVTVYQHHEALLAWYLIDEPSTDVLTLRSVLQASRFVKEWDPRHPIFVVLISPERDAAFTEALDILGIGPYPVPNQRLSLVSKFTQDARRAVGQKKPVWTVIQAHAKPSDRGRSRFPTRVEFRNMIYQALISGSTGVLYFSYEWEGTIDVKNPDLWGYMAFVNKELRSLAPILLRGRDLVDVVQAKPSGQILTRVKEVSGRLYLFVANVTDETTQVEFSVPIKGLNRAQVLFEGRVVPAKQGTFADSFPPYSARVYLL